MTSGQSKPWGYVVRYSVYVEGQVPSENAIFGGSEAIEEAFAVEGLKAATDFIGASVDVVDESPRDQVAS